LDDHDALNPQPPGFGWKPLNPIADELGTMDGSAHPQRVFEPRKILRKVGAGETEDLMGGALFLSRVLPFEKSPRRLNGAAQHLLLRRSGLFQARARLEDDLLKLLRSLRETALGDRSLKPVELAMRVGS